MNDKVFESINRRMRELRDRDPTGRLTVKCVVDPDIYPGVPLFQDFTLRLHPDDARDFDRRIDAMLQGRSEQQHGGIE